MSSAGGADKAGSAISGVRAGQADAGRGARYRVHGRCDCSGRRGLPGARNYNRADIHSCIISFLLFDARFCDEARDSCWLAVRATVAETTQELCGVRQSLNSEQDTHANCCILPTQTVPKFEFYQDRQDTHTKDPP